MVSEGVADRKVTECVNRGTKPIWRLHVGDMDARTGTDEVPCDTHTTPMHTQPHDKGPRT